MAVVVIIALAGLYSLGALVRFAGARAGEEKSFGDSIKAALIWPEEVIKRIKRHGS